MKASEFAYELLLEQRQQEEELQELENDYRTPDWAWPDEEPSNFYTGYKGKTLKQLRDDIGFGDLSL